MTENDALEKFSAWYEDCIESGLEPEKIVSMVGGMALITDEDIVSRLQEAGDISSY